MHPKTDEQRKRLAQAVSKSFLFRSLDQEQSEEVLDAIFERQVSKKNGIIIIINHLLVKNSSP